MKLPTAELWGIKIEINNSIATLCIAGPGIILVAT